MARILVIDDEETIRFAFETFLTDAGHTVVCAGSYGDALERMGESPFDLVFADIVLGDGSGIDILGNFQERDPGCPVVMITGSPDIETAAQAIRFGAFDYIPKPVLQRALLDVTARALQHKALVDEKERYRSHLEAIFASVKDAVIAVDKNLLVTEMNGAATEICGLSRDAVGKTFGSLQHCSGEACLGLLTTIINDGKCVAAQRIECQPAGRPKRIVSIDASPLLDGRSIPSGAVLVVKDETRLDHLERDLEERRQFHNSICPGRKRAYRGSESRRH